MLEKLNPHYSFTSPATVHDEEALTTLELVGRTAKKVNEVVEAQNNFEIKTDNKMTEQDNKIRISLASQDASIREMNDITLPGKVNQEFEKRVENGTFEGMIDNHIGNLKERVDTILNESSGGNNEVVDIRTDNSGITFPNAGESVRHSEKYVTIPLKFNTYIGVTFTDAGWNYNDIPGYKVSNAVEINPNWKKIYFKTKNPNPHIGHILFTRKDDMLITSFVKVECVSTAGEHEIDIPEGAKFMYVANDSDYNGNDLGKPGVYYHKYNYDKSTGDIISTLYEFGDPTKHGYINKPIEFNTNAYRIMKSDGLGGVVLQTTPGYYISYPIQINMFSSLILDVFTPNQHLFKYAFSTSKNINDPMMYGEYIYTKGRYVLIPPNGAKYIYIASDTDVDGNTRTEPKLYGNDDRNIKNLMTYVEHPEDAKDNTTIEIPDGYTFNTVVGKPLELYYEGLIHTPDPNNYYVDIEMDVGSNLKRKFIFTPEQGDVGMHEGVITLRNMNGNIIDQKNFNINVVNPSTGKTATILTIGDSLTSGGEWITELRTMISSTDKNTCRFVGNKTGTGNIPNTNAKFEAIPGYSVNLYNANEGTNPFYNPTNNSIDFAWYMNQQTYKNMNYAIIFLGWNHSTLNKDVIKQEYETLISNIKLSFPNVKIILVGMQKPDIDGLGNSYGTSWKEYEKISFMYDHFKILNEIAVNDDNIKLINISARFDTLYNMPFENKQVNPRNTTTERVITNGVHPANEGYMQIADIIYSELTAILQEAE